jgi:drug/metabolite transporter (DMT)-like permease
MEIFMRSGHLGWVPWVFVLLWSTGFIGAKLGLPYIGPFTFLAYRMAFTLLCFAGLIVYMRAPWPTWKQARSQWISGLLVHAAYLGGVFAAIKMHVPAGLTALLVGLQPLLTAFISHFWLHEKLAGRQWLGMVVGLAGTALVVAGTRGLSFSLGGGIEWVMLALIGITAGTIYQKRQGQGMNLLTGTFNQYLATLAATTLVAWWQERGQAVFWSLDLIVAMAWSVLGLSVAAILLLMRMIREGKVSTVVSYLYLVPGLTALEAWAFFGEHLSVLGGVGIAVAALGVAWVLKPPLRREAAEYNPQIKIDS